MGRQTYVQELLRRLLLMGVPLLPSACRPSDCSDPPRDVTLEVANPTALVDAGWPFVTPEAYEKCAEALDCAALCRHAFPGAVILKCDRVPTDGFSSSDEKLAIAARIDPLEPVCGRRPEGFAEVAPMTRRAQARTAGDFFARAAHLEAVSVPAFERLADELTAHDAPAPLVRSARRAATDERRHHQVMSALAGRFGAEPPVEAAAVLGPFARHVRSMEEIAVENAVEGCAREMVGALLTREQAGRSTDVVARGAFRHIARDELAHADLAFAIDAWMCERLPTTERRRVRAAREETLHSVLVDATSSADRQDLQLITGLPSMSETAHLLTALSQLLS